MLLGALLDAGADVERVRGAIASLGVPGLGLRTEAARRGGLACLRAVITTPAVTDRERHLADVLGHVGASDLRPAGKDLATRVFRLLAEAEGAVHGEPPEDVHFHARSARTAAATACPVLPAVFSKVRLSASNPSPLISMVSVKNVPPACLAFRLLVITTSAGDFPIPTSVILV